MFYFADPRSFFFTPALQRENFHDVSGVGYAGPDYRFLEPRWNLEVVLGTDGRLAGDLVLVGRGDPDLSKFTDFRMTRKLSSTAR